MLHVHEDRSREGAHRNTERKRRRNLEDRKVADHALAIHYVGRFADAITEHKMPEVEEKEVRPRRVRTVCSLTSSPAGMALPTQPGEQQRPTS